MHKETVKDRRHSALLRRGPYTEVDRLCGPMIVFL
jgi:hypothetical protein